MALTIQKLIVDAKSLVDRLKDHDNSADTLIAQTHTLHKRIDAMRMYEENMQELNVVARHRPRSTLVLGIAQENRQIRELQQENKELRLSLEEHQSALELVMSKYREQILKLIMANKLEQNTKGVNDSDGAEVRDKIDKICEMAAIMQKAVTIDDYHLAKDAQNIQRLEVENQGLREMLEVCTTIKHPILSSGAENNETGACMDHNDSVDSVIIVGEDVKTDKDAAAAKAIKDQENAENKNSTG